MKNLMLTTVSLVAFAGAASAFTSVDQIDANGDGSASIEEAQAFAPTLSTDEFRAIDKDNSNMWDRFEVESAEAQGLLRRDDTTQAATVTLKDLDTDGDGKATFAELSPVYATLSQQEFDMVDADNSNAWDEGEITGEAMGLLRRDSATPYSDGVAVLADIDADGDGMATYEEVMAVESTITKAEFQMVDVDNSNNWDRLEVTSEAAQTILSRM